MQPAALGLSTHVPPPRKAALMPPWNMIRATDSTSTTIATINT